MISLGILGVLFAATIPRIFRLQSEEQLDYAAQSLANFIIQARNLALHSPSQTDLEISGQNSIGQNEKVISGTIVTAEPPENDYTRLSIREWQAPKSDNPDVDMLPAELINLQDKDKRHGITLDPMTHTIYYPVIKSIRLPKGIYIEKERSGVFVYPFAGASPSPTWTPSTNPDPALSEYPYLVFARFNAGKPVIEAYSGVTSSVINQGAFIRLKVCDKGNCNANSRDDDDESFRFVDISVPQGGVTIANR